MNKRVKTNLSTGIITASMLATVFAPAAFAEAKLDITDNGNGSVNTIVAAEVKIDLTEQSNQTEAVTLTAVLQNTGSNTVSNNSGSEDIKAISGDAVSEITAITDGGNNKIVSGDCGCDKAPDIKVSQNGKNSDNLVIAIDGKLNITEQQTNTSAVNGILVLQNTGSNKAKANTGKGQSVTLKTGKAKSTVKTKVTGGSNIKK